MNDNDKKGSKKGSTEETIVKDAPQALKLDQTKLSARRSGANQDQVGHLETNIDDVTVGQRLATEGGSSQISQL